MNRAVFDQDIRPISELREKATAFVQQVRETQRPMVITQHGRSVAVLMDVAQYEQLMERLEILEAVQVGEGQIAEGKFSDSKTSRKAIALKHGRQNLDVEELEQKARIEE